MSNSIRVAGKRDGTLDSVAASSRESLEPAVRQRLPGASQTRASCAWWVWGLPEPQLSSQFMEGEIPIANKVQSH